MSWELLTGISVIGLSASILLQRILLHNYKTDPYAYVIIFQLTVGLMLGVYSVATGVPGPDLTNLWPLALLCMAAYGIGHIFYAKTLQLVDASVFSVFFASHAVWMMLFGVMLFGETLGIAELLGSGLIFTSILVLVKKSSWRTVDKGLLYGLLTGVIFAVAITSWSYIGREVETTSWAAWSFIGGALVALLVHPRAVGKIRQLATGHREVLIRMTILAALYGIGSLAMLYAYKYGDISVVSPLRQTGIVVTVLLALLFIPAERVSIGKKLVAAVISLAGAALILI